ncbi:hypothetical protein D5086_021043 [Populus alba]|uniref:Uncharacterized protein n=1 Tax=Populus alba TaxID=43335 RepID=A0ACC4BLX1_POPAL
MGIFEEMGFCNNLDFFSAPPGEMDAVPEREPGATIEEDYSDEEMDVDELERRMWRDRMLLRRLKEQGKNTEVVDHAKHRQSQEQARRKKMSRAQDGILKYMLKMMEVCKAQGFVYGIIPEKGKPVSGASDNLRGWWKEKVRFDRNGPAAISKYQAEHSIPGKNSCPPVSAGGSGSCVISDSSDYDVEGVDDEPIVEVEDCKHLDVNLFNMATAAGPRDRFMMPPAAPQIKGELVETSMDFIQKRKQPAGEPHILVDQKVYRCEHPQCPYNDSGLGFLDITARNNHQMNCLYRTNASQGLGLSNFQINSDKPAVFSLPFPQTKAAAPNQTPSLNVSGLRLSEDGQKTISDLMSFYDTNLQRDKNINPGSANLDDSFYGQGAMVGNNITEATSMPVNNPVFSSTENQFDHCKAFDSAFDTNVNDSITDFRFGSPFPSPPVDYSMDLIPKQDVGMCLFNAPNQFFKRHLNRVASFPVCTTHPRTEGIEKASSGGVQEQLLDLVEVTRKMWSSSCIAALKSWHLPRICLSWVQSLYHGAKLSLIPESHPPCPGFEARVSRWRHEMRSSLGG